MELKGAMRRDHYSDDSSDDDYNDEISDDENQEVVTKQRELDWDDTLKI